MEMKKAVYLVLIVFALLFVGVLPVYADGHWHGGHGHGHGGHGHFFFSGDIFIGPGWGGWAHGGGVASYYPYYPNYPYYCQQTDSHVTPCTHRQAHPRHGSIIFFDCFLKSVAVSD